MAWALQERDAKGADSSTKEGHLIPTRRGGFFDGPTHTLTGNGHDASEDGTGRGVPIVLHPSQDPISSTDGSTHALSCGAKQGQASVAIACFKGGQGSKARGIGLSPTLSPTLSAAPSGSNQAPTLLHGYGVRRLMPIECERLMGWPDNHTAGFADSTRYRMAGNGVVSTVAEWIGKRIVRVLQS